MRKKNCLSTALLQVSLDETTDRILERMISVGIHGKNKSEVASWIIREWIWQNQAQLAGVGISVSENIRVKHRERI
jgi:hypothetical protein